MKSLSRVWLFATPWTVAYHGIFQARVLEWVAISFSRGSSEPRDWTWVSCIVGRHFIIWATREVTMKPWNFIIRDTKDCPLPKNTFYAWWPPLSTAKLQGWTCKQAEELVVDKQRSEWCWVALCPQIFSFLGTCKAWHSNSRDTFLWDKHWSSQVSSWNKMSVGEVSY